MKFWCALLSIFVLYSVSQTTHAQIVMDSFRMYGDVRITLDRPQNLKEREKNILILYALPNGNTTGQTMGKKIMKGDDWHFDIQHIKAQTAFIRSSLKENVIVAYLENDYRSWPRWKQKHPQFRTDIVHIVDTLTSLFPSGRTEVQLNGHSGGGSFIFGYIEAVPQIPSIIRRITFLDSNYGYDTLHYSKFRNWLKMDQAHTVIVFAYNDSIALYQNKPVVSPTGGTWYRSRLFQRQIEEDFRLRIKRSDSLIIIEHAERQIAFYLRENPGRRIYHTQQVELNGFIHSVLYRTRKESKGYRYLGQRAYTRFIE